MIFSTSAEIPSVDFAATRSASVGDFWAIAA
jgi:hypothetical protein